MSECAPVNIYIVGTQSTGKTTLVNALRQSFNDAYSPPKIISEVARGVLDRHKFTADDITSSPERCLQLQTLIMEAQLRAEREASKLNQFIISDRSGVDPLTYARYYLGPHAADDIMKSTTWQELHSRMQRSLIFVCEAGTDWLVDDGVRLMPRDTVDWLNFHEEFCRVLEQVGLGYEIIPCTMSGMDERTSFVWAKWREAMAINGHGHGPMVELNGKRWQPTSR